MTRDSRPTVFVSSTIYDFRDLRSAIRFWLEECGYRVLFSEFNDFPQTPSENSYDSCIQAIDESDYFVLLIGGRVGGMYSQDISITRMEYRHAYQRLKAGKIKITPIVRREIWGVREDRKALHRYLKKEATLDPELARSVANHPSKLIDDAKHIFEFLNEITRNEEMKVAAKGSTPRPIGNWIYQFTDFRDVVDALRTVLGVKGHLRKAALAATLKLEVARNLRRLYSSRRVDGEDYIPTVNFSRNARNCFRGDHNDSSLYKGSDLGLLGTFMICSLSARGLEEFALREAVTSGEFLEYDIQTNQYIPGHLQEALLAIIERIGHLNGILADDRWLGDRFRLVEQYKHAGDQSYSIPNSEIVLIFAVHDRISDLCDLFKAVYKALNGDTSLADSCKLRPLSPTEAAARVSDSCPSLASIIELLES